MIKCFWTVLSISLALLLLSFILFIGGVGENVRNSIIRSKFTLTPTNTAFFSSWTSPTGLDGRRIGSDYDFYLWNITNGNEVITGAVPILQEVGPFCYTNYNEHVNISTRQNGIVSYQNRQTYHPRNCHSRLTGDEIIYHVNVPFLLIHDQIRVKSKFIQSLVKGMFPSDWTIFTAHSAHDLIWGYDDPVLTTIKTFGYSPIGKFGYFLGQNGSDSMVYEIHDGSDQITDLSHVTKWNTKDTLDPIWSSDLSNSINGTDGNLFPPLLEKDERLYVFVDSMCRSIYFEAEEEEAKLGPIDTWKFTLPKEVFQGVKNNPDNVGFCPEGHLDCQLGGVLNLTSCYKETYDMTVPILMSKPHLLDADDSFHAVLQGLSPAESLHGTRLYIEPVTGFLLGAEKNLQVNFHISSTLLSEAGMDSKTLNKYPRGLLLPAHWVSQRFTASPDQLNYVANNILSLLSLVHHFPLILLAIAVTGTLMAFLIGVRIHLGDEKGFSTKSSNGAVPMDSNISSIEKEIEIRLLEQNVIKS